jgi:DNA-binding IclR family transcriptional regulator
MTQLSGGEQTILQMLINAYPEGVDRDAISEATGYQRSSRNTYLQRLGARRLITNGSSPRASDMLFD